MIEYLHTNKTIEQEPLKVKVDGRISGEIRKVLGGYQYFPKGCKKKFCGEIFPSILEVQKSLSDDT
jgi:hypothetical protein